ncbi:hypothetical protein A8W25_28730 [Streptomyces sp. ERV7]|uniref:DUF6896 domain-containing protein n=1 Tax=Streptomyces sp. ERV7 TaxID=1322334 RepID=UPI0007F36247|nr:hypothetical protein A8W25_28730 [Streptomyces sp. ERV7]
MRSFLRYRTLIRTALAGNYPQFDTLEHVLEAVRAGELERRGQSDAGFSYSVHGRGCRMVGADGAEIEMDLLLDGAEAFDVWRLEVFARSVGMSPVPPRGDLMQECRDMTQEGVLDEPEPGWFRLIE